MIKFIGTNFLIESEEIVKGSIEELIRECKSRGSVSVDIESSGLNFLDDFIILLSMGWTDVQYVIDVRYRSDISLLKEVMESKDIVKIFHNATFDMKFLMKILNCRFENIHDTMLAEQLISNGYPVKYNLQAVLERRLGVTISKDVRSNFSKYPDKLPGLEEIVYSATDVMYLEKLKTDQLLTIRNIDINLECNLRSVLNLENSMAIAIAEMEYEGMSIDVSKWKEISLQNKEGLGLAVEVLDTFILENPKLSKFKCKTLQLDMFTPSDQLRRVSVNWDSPKQVKEVFETLLGETIESVMEPKLQKYMSEDLIYNYVSYKKLSKLYTSYGSSFLTNLYSDGKIHTSFRQILATGRMSSSQPNMQQIPQEALYRNCFITGDPNYVFVSCDYSSQELSIIALKSEEPSWIKTLQAGKDLHSMCAALVFGAKWKSAALPTCVYESEGHKCECPQHKKLRSLIKTINFGLAYGMSEFKFSNTARIPVQEAKDIIDKYFKTFPRIKIFLESLASFGISKRYITTFFPYRRIRWFSKSKDSKEVGKIERRSKNTPIQGCGADMTKIATVAARNWLKNNPQIRAKLVMTVHDQLDSICHVEDVDKWAPIMKKILEESALPMFTGGEIKAEITISEKWEK